MSVNVSDGGVPKRAVPEARITVGGVAGDRQRDLRFHGGPRRAVCLYSLEVIQSLQAEGHPIGIGSAGENVTVSGLDWALMAPGRRVRVGAALLKLTSYAHPCSNLVPCFRDGNFVRVSQKVHPGASRVYAEVLEEGVVRSGDPVEILDSAQLSVEMSKGSVPERIRNP